jgi:peptidoglycan/LPS O-acetylase OafA/YrhL
VAEHISPRTPDAEPRTHTPERGLLRSVQAIAAGYLLFAIAQAAIAHVTFVPSTEPPSALVATVTIVCGIAAALVSGWLTARMSATNAIGHAVILAFLIAIVALVAFFVTARVHWRELLTMFVFAPMAVAGAVAGQRPLRRAASGAGSPGGR